MKSAENLIRLFPTIQNNRVLDLFDERKNLSLSGAGNFSSKAFAFADVIRKNPEYKTILWVVNDHIEQESVIRSLKLWTDLEVYGFSLTPSDVSKMKAVDAENKIKTVEFVSRVVGAERKVIVTPYINLMGNLPQAEAVKGSSVRLKKGEHINTTELFEALIDKGYEVSDDKFLKKGKYIRSGEIVSVFPVNTEKPLRLEIGFDRIERICFYDQETKEDLEELKVIEIVPLRFDEYDCSVADYFDGKTVVVEDELDIIDEYYDAWNALFDEVYEKVKSIAFVSFNEDDENHQHLHYISVLKYRGAYDLANDMREKQRDEWRTMIFTKESGEIKTIFKEYNIAYHTSADNISITHPGIFIFDLDKEEILPQAFQNPELKLALISDKEFSSMREEKKKVFNQKVYLDFLTSLKVNDYVVHANHGIGRFIGLEKKTVDDVTREYMKIGYAENDKLFVPIDQADKVNKYIGAEEQPPKLTRLGSAEWDTITKKVQKETEAIARELLQLYAQRKSARGVAFKHDNDLQIRFEEAFPYEETPGQLQSIVDS